MVIQREGHCNSLSSTCLESRLSNGKAHTKYFTITYMFSISLTPHSEVCSKAISTATVIYRALADQILRPSILIDLPEFQCSILLESRKFQEMNVRKSPLFVIFVPYTSPPLLSTKMLYGHEHMNQSSPIFSWQQFGTCPLFLGPQYCKSNLMYVEKAPMS